MKIFQQWKLLNFRIYQGWGAGAGRSRPFLRGAGAAFKKNGRLRLLINISEKVYFLVKMQLKNFILFCFKQKIK